MQEVISYSLIVTIGSITLNYIQINWIFPNRAVTSHSIKIKELDHNIRSVLYGYVTKLSQQTPEKQTESKKLDNRLEDVLVKLKCKEH